MCAVWLSTTCRVCLASDRESYRLANTALEETYERVTSWTLVVEGRPCCVCGVCLSALRRCRRFIDTAREANITLDQWSRNQPNTDTLKLTERPLFFLTRSPTKIFEMTCLESGIQELRVKQERDPTDNSEMIDQQYKGTSDDEGNIPKEEIKYEVTSDDDNDNTQISDNIESHNPQVLSNSECINVYDNMIDIEIDTQTVDNVKFEVPKMLDNVKDKTTPDASNVGQNQVLSDEDIPLRRLRSRKRIKPSEDTEDGRALKKGRPITLEHRRGNTDPAAALHNEGDTFSCTQCNYNTKNKYRLKAHFKTHIGEKPFTCETCDYKFITKCNLKKHLLIHTGVKPFSCDKCDYKCTQKSSLKLHLMRHIGEKPFSCNKCDYKCTKKSDLSRHLFRHTGEKPFSCDNCDYTCSQKALLKHHVLTHIGEKRFSCDKCDYKCLKMGSLKMHLMRHNGEKPFLCDKCDYKSITKFNLKQHLLTHTGEKPHSCDKCDYKCIQKSSLKQHLLKHSEKLFLCDKCDRKYVHKCTLDKHVKKMHTGNNYYASKERTKNTS